jgi:cobalt-zinc-cadmium efflux system membrane fusion protein
MKRLYVLEAGLCVALTMLAAGCGKGTASAATQDGDTGPHTAEVEQDMDPNNVRVDDASKFPTVEAATYAAAPELKATGVVSPDISRQVPVPSLASGKIVAINARLGDEVKKGQILFQVRSNDIAGAFSEYRKAVKNEELAKVQLQRAQLLFDNGAVAKSMLEVAQNAEENAQVDLETTQEHLRLLGSDPDHPTGIVNVPAPVGGVITDQQINIASGVQALTPPNPFTISDVSHVWILCDVYENDLSQVRMGEYADVRLNAYPDQIFRGRIGNIGQILDPNLRTAKVRLEMENPGIMRFGMFVTATFHGVLREPHASVPSTAVLHLHDRDWVYVPTGGNGFHRVTVTGGAMLPGNLQEILTGIKPGQQVVANALVLQNTVEQ